MKLTSSEARNISLGLHKIGPHITEIYEAIHQAAVDGVFSIKPWSFTSIAYLNQWQRVAILNEFRQAGFDVSKDDEIGCVISWRGGEETVSEWKKPELTRPVRLGGGIVFK